VSLCSGIDDRGLVGADELPARYDNGLPAIIDDQDGMDAVGRLRLTVDS
jgi:hypothetical protein